MVLSYVRDLLEEITGERPEPDHNGDLVVNYGGATFHTRVVNPEDPVVRVFSIVITNLPETPELFAAINRINQNIAFARAVWSDGHLAIETEIWGCDVNPGNFSHSLGNIASAADQHVPQVVASFGGAAEHGQLADSPSGQVSLFCADGNGAYL